MIAVLICCKADGQKIKVKDSAAALVKDGNDNGIDGDGDGDDDDDDDVKELLIAHLVTLLAASLQQAVGGKGAIETSSSSILLLIIIFSRLHSSRRPLRP
eukprot:213658-Hanusia_phi.AAC.1